MKIHKFENGLTVVVHPMPTAVVTVDCWVATGSAEEAAHEWGVAHFLEHVMFKGTPRHGVNELDAAITGLGGAWNAGTSMDFTHYHVTVPAEHFERATDVIADMMMNASIDADEFEKERAVVLEEILRKEDSPVGCLYEQLYESAYDVGPYRHSVLGTAQSVGEMKHEDMVSFYRRFYTPDNAVLVIAGDVIEGDAETVARQYFGAWQGERPPRKSATTTFAQGGEVKCVHKDVNENYQVLAWPACGVDDVKTMLALDVAADLLAGSRSTRLVRRLREELGLVGSVSCGLPSHLYPSLFTVMTAHSAENAEAARTETLRVVELLAQDGPTQEELARSRRKLRNDLYYSMEETEDVSSMVGYWYVLTGSTELVEQYPQLLETITADDVRTAVADVLKHAPVCVGVVEAEAK